ncbi:hypothetical protein C8546_23050 [Salmonella enterica subsp. enterica serovar Muenchen]|nr:hypothetical protein [Salmonella enterica subsp. enterica serovar Muenchen]
MSVITIEEIDSNTKLSDLYHALLYKSLTMNEQASQEKDALYQQQLSSLAFDNEVYADYIAHCIVICGDIPIKESIPVLSMYLSSKKKLSVRGQMCCGRDPWLRGLNLLKKYTQKEIINM